VVGRRVDWRPVNLRALRPLVDPVICVALVGFTIPATFDPAAGPNGSVLGALLLPAVVLPVLVRHRAPLLAAAGLLAGTVVSAVPSFDQFRITAAIPAALLVAYACGSRSPRREATWGLGLVFAAMAFLALTDSGVRQDGGGGLTGTLLFTVPLCSAVWAAGRAVWSRDRVAEQLVARTARLMQQREQSAAVAVEIERSRLAAELDATAQERLRALVALSGAGDGGAERFARIEQLGRGTLDEMRGMLGVLRSDERGERAPRPTLAQLDELLASVRAGGRPVELEVEGEPRALGAGLELAVYRAIQHALQATTQRTRVRVRYEPWGLGVEVDGPRRPGAAATAALVAARERVVAYGGELGDGPILVARIPAVTGG
jgi:signal transduction histidine kinase